MKRANGFGSVIKLAGKRRNPYAAKVTDGWTLEGKQIIRYIGYYPTKREALKALEAYNTNPYNLETKDLTVIEIFEKWHAQQTLNQNTVKTYTSAFKKCHKIYKKSFKDVKLIELDYCMGLQSSTMKKPFKNLMTALYKYAIKHEIVDRNLAEHLEYESVQSKVRNTFEMDHIQKLWDNVDNHRLADIPIILLYTGMRINELLTLESKNVYLDDRYMIGGLKTKNGKNRVIPIHEKIAPLIRKRLDQGNTYLITDKRGNMVKDNALRATEWPMLISNYLGTRYTAHETRHTFVTQMSKQGIDKGLIQKIVGHALTDITDHYIHTTKEQLIEAINKLEYK